MSKIFASLSITHFNGRTNAPISWKKKKRNTAVGGAAIYMAYRFLRLSTPIFFSAKKKIPAACAY